MEIYLAIPVTSCQVECSFSTLRRLKTCKRSKIGQEQLSNLSLITIERELADEIDIETLIDNFATMKDRRMQFF